MTDTDADHVAADDVGGAAVGAADVAADDVGGEVTGAPPVKARKLPPYQRP